MRAESGNAAGVGRREDLARVDAAMAQAWQDEKLTSAAPEAVERLAELLSHNDPLVVASVLVALGVLHESRADDPRVTAETRAAVESNVDTVLGLAVVPSESRALRLSFVYHLAHFPGRRTEIDKLGLGVPRDDRARLKRCLTPPTEGEAERYEIGRAWPTPAIWQLTEAERELDRAWQSTLDLCEVDVLDIAELETTAVLAFLGAQAEFAIWEASVVR
ncbi:hypothetical protein AB5J62_24990 [Amycolatopsis sp. cg5]|uniref:hypothetical protein n=1 Tax=Amycolatopsis sp. cg5 TaxID=3238802 RepID=UPI003525CC6F